MKEIEDKGERESHFISAQGITSQSGVMACMHYGVVFIHSLGEDAQ